MANDPNKSLEQLHSLADRLEQLVGSSNAKAANTISALRDEIERARQGLADQDELLQKFSEAYEKLTQPANRIGLFLRHLEDGLVQVMLGDTEYVALVDPHCDLDALQPGQRVRLNEAFAVVGSAPSQIGGQMIAVTQVIEGGKLRVSSDVHGQQGRIIERSALINDLTIKVGDEVLLDSSGKIALEHWPKKGSENYFIEEITPTPWSAVGGQQEAIDLIKESIEQPLLYPDLYKKFDKKPPKGILLYGPPGCGKTLLGKAIAYNLAADYRARTGIETARECFLHISGPKVLNMWLGETERMIREIFTTAREKASEGNIVVVFIDEAESILRTRSSGRWLNISNTVVPQFCAEMDGLESLENVVIVLTSNRPDYIDPAILRPERIDRKIRIKRPNQEAARDILDIYLSPTLPIDDELIKLHDGEACARKALLESTLAHLWQSTNRSEFLVTSTRDGLSKTLHWRDFVSGAILKSIVDRAKDSAIRRAIAEPKKKHGLTHEDLNQAVDAEFKENEIFPKSDAAEDWIKLLDLEHEDVVAVRPVNSSPVDRIRKSVI
jgi:proteasome-associated ATPase